MIYYFVSAALHAVGSAAMEDRASALKVLGRNALATSCSYYLQASVKDAETQHFSVTPMISYSRAACIVL
jgi:hypothetical protein